jgi:hypothetical protein
MNKVFILKPSEDWIVDRFVSEWYEDNPDISTQNPSAADVIWLFADWCYSQVDFEILKKKKVITTIHHVVKEKFDLNDFKVKDSITTVYHVPNKHTETFIKQFTNKQIKVIPYWANQKIWKTTDDKRTLRRKYGLPDEFLVGSFQRDTEGFDLKSPKLEKGPDLLADYLEYKNSLCISQKLHVVLAGWRRQYIMKRLKDANIGFSYFERPSHRVINELYQCIDIYPVSARCEGGPQSIIECGLLNIPVISRDIGMASQLLTQESINDNLILTKPSIPNVEHLKLPNGYRPYRDLIEAL